jgi:transcriptional regulator with XRE-family HTH domain
MKFAFSKALRHTRKSRGLTQKDFLVTSNHTYLSTLKKDKKNPTFDKNNAIAQTLGIHFVSLNA